VRSRGGSPVKGDANLLPASVPDIGRSLRMARELADLSLPEAGGRTGLTSSSLEALETGNWGNQHDRIGMLRILRTYANSLGLPGDDYVLVAIEHWPSAEHPLTHSGDTAVVPVVSISSAPAGGHSPAGPGSVWPGDANGVADAAITGVIAPLPPGSALDTGRLRIVDTGQVPAVRNSAPRFLKVLVTLSAILVALGGAALAEHAHIDGWAHDTRVTTSHWVKDVKSALGFSTRPAKPAGHATTGSTSPRTSGRPHTSTGHHLITYTTPPNGQGLTVKVAASSFTVKVVAVNGACWIQATTAGQPTPTFAGDLLAGQTRDFTVTGSMTLETGSSAGRAFFYQGTKLIGYYFPTKVPFQMQLDAVS
jgi:hypothetical protein